MLAKFIGFGAAILTTLAFFPQARKTWKTRSTKDHSPLMYFLFCTGVALWLLYGILKNDAPMIFANSVTLVLAGSIMYFIIKGKEAVSVAHVAIYVSDLEKMKIFYCEELGGTAGKKYQNPQKGFTSYFITFNSACSVELMHEEKSVHTRTEFSRGHIALAVGSEINVKSKIEQMRRKRITIISEPRITGDGYFEATISDPEGNVVEITV